MSLERLQEAIDKQNDAWSRRRLSQAQQEARQLFQVPHEIRQPGVPKNALDIVVSVPREFSLRKAESLAKKGKLIPLLEDAWQQLRKDDPDLCAALMKDSEFDPLDLLEVSPADKPLKLVVPGKRDVVAARLASEGLEDESPAGIDPLAWKRARCSAKKLGIDAGEWLTWQAKKADELPFWAWYLREEQNGFVGDALNTLDLEGGRDDDEDNADAELEPADKDDDSEPDGNDEPNFVPAFRRRSLDLQPHWWAPEKTEAAKSIRHTLGVDIGDERGLRRRMVQVADRLTPEQLRDLGAKVDKATGGDLSGTFRSIELDDQADFNAWGKKEALASFCS